MKAQTKLKAWLHTESMTGEMAAQRYAPFAFLCGFPVPSLLISFADVILRRKTAEEGKVRLPPRYLLP
jgi:hypothetical protein